MEKTRKNLTIDPLTRKIVEGKSSEEICYLIQIGNAGKEQTDVVNIVSALFQEVEELKEMTKALAQLMIEKD